MTIWLHIGSPKAGSSTLQHFLENNLGALRERGIVVPRSASRLSHRRLKIYALDDDIMDNLKRAKAYTTPQRIAHFRATFRERLMAESAGWRAEDQIFMTCEQLVDVRTPSGLARLAELLRPLGHDVRILLYLRRQDELLTSLYVQRVRGGLTTPFQDFIEEATTILPRYEEIVPDWAAHFGEKAIIVRPLERSQLKGGSIIDDALSWLGLDDLTGLVIPADQNASLSASCTEFLRYINPHIPRWLNERPNLARKTIVQGIEAISSGEKIRLSGAQARALIEIFAAGNAELARRWMGRDDGILFRDPIDERPAIAPSLTLEEAGAWTAALALRLLETPPPRGG